MSVLITLMRREFWEHRSLLWSPVLVVGVMLVLYALGLLFGVGNRLTGPIAEITRSGSVPLPLDNVSSIATSLFAKTGFPVILVTVTLVFMFIAFAYVASSVFDERKDRSVLFWRSLPVSDTLTLVSKWMTAILVAPIYTAIVVTAGYLILLAIFWLTTAARGGAQSLTFANDIVTTLGAAGFAVYVLLTATIWLAPLFGFCMLVASWATRAPLVSAVIPVLLVAFGSIFVLPDVSIIGWIWDNLFLMTQYVTTSFDFSQVDFNADRILSQVFSMDEVARDVRPGVYLSIADPVSFLSSLRVWFGLIVSLILLGGAIYIRRYRDEVL